MLSAYPEDYELLVCKKSSFQIVIRVRNNDEKITMKELYYEESFRLLKLETMLNLLPWDYHGYLKP